MKFLSALAGLFVLAPLAHAADTFGMPADGAASDPAFSSTAAPATLDALLNPGSPSKPDTSPLRLQMISDAGRTVGFRGGMAARATEIRTALEKRTEQLSQLFNFAPLVSPSGALPPVIVEAQDVASFSPEQYRLASKVYKIARPERFVSTPPTWRDYLYTGLPAQASVDMPIAAAQPKTGDEKDAWDKAVRTGWTAGVENCNAIMRANFARMTRDYTGMVAYSTLLQQGMISQTRVAETQRTVTGNTGELTIGDTTRKLARPAQFQPDSNTWKPTVSYVTGLQAQPVGTYPVSQFPATAQPGLAIPVPSAPGTGQTSSTQNAQPSALASSSSTSAGIDAKSSPTPQPATPASASESAPASAPESKPEPVPAPSPRTWTAKQGATLRDVIVGWGESATPPWHVAWQTDLNYPIVADFDVTADDFLHVVAKTFNAYSRAKRQFRLSQQPDQHVLVVEEEKP